MESYVLNKLNDLGVFASIHTVEETEKYIEDNFTEISFTDEFHENTAYFQEDVFKYFLKDSDGIYIKITKGDGDRFGSTHSHNGIDICVGNVFNDEVYFVLFNESKQNNLVQKGLYDVVVSSKDVALLSKDKIVDYFNSYYSEIAAYNILPENLRKDEEIIDAVVEKIASKAELIHWNQVEYDRISPYGGLDAEIEEIYDIFNSLTYTLDCTDNELLKNKLEEKYLSFESKQRDIKEDIRNLETQLSFLVHEEEYLQLDNVFQDFIKDCKDIGCNAEYILDGFEENYVEDELKSVQKEYSECVLALEQAKLLQRDIVEKGNIFIKLSLIFPKNRETYEKEKLSLAADISRGEEKLKELTETCKALEKKLETTRKLNDEFDKKLVGFKVDTLPLYNFYFPVGDYEGYTQSKYYDSFAKVIEDIKKNSEGVENRLASLKSMLRDNLKPKKEKENNNLKRTKKDEYVR